MYLMHFIVKLYNPTSEHPSHGLHIIIKCMLVACWESLKVSFFVKIIGKKQQNIKSRTKAQRLFSKFSSFFLQIWFDQPSEDTLKHLSLYAKYKLSNLYRVGILKHNNHKRVKVCQINYKHHKVENKFWIMNGLYMFTMYYYINLSINNWVT